jgi:ribonuclease HI
MGFLRVVCATAFSPTTFTPTKEGIMITIYTDGSCLGNPGPGGWAALLQHTNNQGVETRKTITGRSRRTTNNRMELRAVLAGLNALKKPDNTVTIYSDSRYVVDGINAWLPNWKRKDWRTTDRKPVANHDLWQQIDAAIQRQEKVTLIWVPGHSNVTGNMLAHDHAESAARSTTDEDKEDL